MLAGLWRMMATRAALIDDDEWRSRGMAAVLTEREIEVRRYPSVDRFAVDGNGTQTVLVSDRLCHGGALARIRETFPSARVLVFGDLDCHDDAARFFAGGAQGCFSLSLSPGKLAEAVRHVAQGKVWGSREALAAALDSRDERDPRPSPYSAEEMRLLRMLEDGLTNKEMAQRLGFAESTIKSRFNRLYRRFGVSSRVQLLTAVMRKGIVDAQLTGGGSRETSERMREASRK